MLRDVITFHEFAECVPEGFKAMIAPILILAMAWTLSGMTNLLGANIFVADLVAGSAQSLQGFLPIIIFAVAAGLAFATGTSWGTFGILIPIVIGVFPSGTMMIISIAACLAGAVCGDHCSPISDTTIMASARRTLSSCEPCHDTDSVCADGSGCVLHRLCTDRCVECSGNAWYFMDRASGLCGDYARMVTCFTEEIR